MALNELWIAGYPSLVGGADTELRELIHLWRRHAVSVHLVPMHSSDPAMRAEMNGIGCVTHDYRPDIFKGKVVASFCNGNFLNELPKIIDKGKPRTVLWANCMTWTFPKELEAHKNGWIDYFIFVSAYQRSWLAPQYEAVRGLRELNGYRPYFDPLRLQQGDKPSSYYGVGRISRDDSHKYSKDMWSIYSKVCSPVPKKIFILGWGENARRQCGNPPIGLSVSLWEPGAMPVATFYNLLHCIIHKTGGSRESYCRIVPEAYAAGVPMIVEKDYAFPEIIVDGVTGYLCSSGDEMAYRASELAYDTPRRMKMIDAARDYLVNDLAAEPTCWEPWRNLLGA